MYSELQRSGRANLTISMDFIIIAENYTIRVSESVNT